MTKGAQEALEATYMAEAKEWCMHNGWEYDEENNLFRPRDFIKVIRNPMEHEKPGWCPWLCHIGALQMSAPFGHPQGALVAADKILRQAR